METLYDVNDVLYIRAKVQSVHIHKTESDEDIITYVLNVPNTNNNIFISEQELQKIDYNPL